MSPFVFSSSVATMGGGDGGTGRLKAELVLTEEEREILQRWARRPRSAQALALRCRIVLACAEGKTNQQVAAAEGVHQATVGKWRARFVTHRLDGLHDEPRPGAPRQISDADVEHVIVRTLKESPRDATHWPTRSMAKATGMSQSAVSRIWRAFGLKPHLAQHFKLSPDPQFIDKVRDIVGLYLNPPDAAVVCVWIRSPCIGPLHERLRLGERMYGEPFLPQTKVLPQCDLLITHGGNNTLGEAFDFGLPMIVLPLFWDQYDNAQRVQETGFGRRLNSYMFEDGEFLGAVQTLLADGGLRTRLRQIAGRLQANPGPSTARVSSSACCALDNPSPADRSQPR